MMPSFSRLALCTLAAVVLATCTLSCAPAEAADVTLHSRVVPPAPALPFARSERAQSVWASGLCWSECGSYTAWNLVACLERDRQGRCLKRADSADRACQRECRSSGGPLLPIDF